VRLSGRFKKLRSADKPTVFVRKLEELDIVALFEPAELNDRLKTLANYFIDRESTRRAGYVRDLLKPDDPATANLVSYQILSQRKQVSGAISLFESKRNWPDGLRQQHVDLLVRIGMYDKALSATQSIMDIKTRTALMAKIYARQNNLGTLSQLTAWDEQSTQWLAIGLAEIDLAESAATILGLAQLSADAAIDVSRILLRHYAAENDQDEYQVEAKNLVSLNSAEMVHLEDYALIALHVEDRPLVKTILQRMGALDRGAPEYSNIKEKLTQSAES
jgi:hypothetical protein